MNALGRLFDIASGFVPVDTQTGTGPTSDYVSLKNAGGVTVVFFKAAGTANDDPVLLFQQATVVAGTDVKDLAVVTEYAMKQGTLTSVTGWTRVTQTASATVTLNATSAEGQGIYVFEVEADQLDVDNGFDCLMVDVADTGAAGAQLGCLLYLLRDLPVSALPSRLPDPLTD